MFNLRIRARFTKKVSITDGCWEWQAYRWPDGYGSFWYNGRNWRAHHISYMIHTGKTIPDGMVIMHTCNNKSCVNPEHLLLGTYSENIRQAYADGLRSRKLNYSIAHTIRESYNAREFSCSQLAQQYNVTESTIWGVVQERLYQEER